MKAFVINLDHATERWNTIKQEAEQIGFCVQRVTAVFGPDLPKPYTDYSPAAYRRFHGKRTNNREIGCYQSHLKAMEMFLESGDQYGVILEDDAEFHPDTVSLVQRAIDASHPWDMLRLSGLHSGSPMSIGRIHGEFKLAVNLSRQTGAGAYVVNRKAALALCQGLRPMKLPYDHAFDREWLYGFKSLSLIPYPVTQNERYATSIEHAKKYGPSRYLTVFPYRMVNESCRVLHRSVQYISHRIAPKKSA